LDVRKHLPNTTDVLNKQREQIYPSAIASLPNRNLTEDVAEMLESEVEKRVELGMDDEEGPWKLIGWLEGVQPPFESRAS